MISCILHLVEALLHPVHILGSTHTFRIWSRSPTLCQHTQLQQTEQNPAPDPLYILQC